MNKYCTAANVSPDSDIIRQIFYERLEMLGAD